jgi:hypothetical protein
VKLIGDATLTFPLPPSPQEPLRAIRLQSRQPIPIGISRLSMTSPVLDPSELTLVPLPRRVPELAVDPRHAGDEAIRFDVRGTSPVSGSIGWIFLFP